SALHHCSLNAGILVLQQLEVLGAADGVAKHEVHAIACKYFLIAGGQKPVGTALETHGHCNRRWWRGKKIQQGERSNAYDAQDRCRSFEQMPTIEPEHRPSFTG